MTLPPELQAALLDRRVIFLRGPLDDAAVNGVLPQLLLASRLGAASPIDLYIDSPAGWLTAALGLYDVINTLGTPVRTTCTGTAGGAAVLVLAAGTKGGRSALPHARIHLSDDPVDVSSSRPDDPAVMAEEARRATARWRAALLQHTWREPELLAADLAAGRWLSASEAREYGLIDRIGASP